MNIKDKSALKYILILVVSGFVFGIDAGLISGTIKFIRTEFSLTDLQVGTVVSAPAFGAIIALLFTGKIAHSLGRKNAMLLIAFMYFLSAVASTFAVGYWSLTLARMLGGMAFCSISLASMYVGELAPAKMRGKLVVAAQVMMGLGFFIAYLINYILILNVSAESILFSPENVWRTMFATEIPVVAIWFAFLLIVPKSPRWLMIKGREKEAEQVVNLVNRDEDVKDVISQIKKNITETACNTPIKQQLQTLLSSNMRLVLYIGVGLAIVQSLSGMGAVSFYAPMIFKQVGLGENSAFFQTTLLGFVSIISALVSVSLIDKIGRKPILIIGLLAISLSHLTIWYNFSNASYSITEANIAKVEKIIDVAPLRTHIGKVFKTDIEFKNLLQQNYGEKVTRLHADALIKAFVKVSATPIISAIFLFKIAFFFSIGPVMWVVFSEITPNSIRSAAIPAFGLIASLFAFFVQRYFPWQLNTFGAADTFLSYALFSGLGVLLVSMILPETKNKSIEEIEDLMVKNKKVTAPIIVSN
ncbi:MFS transporter [Psychromonas sp. SA13A]|uniref:MFS transporter n=1 Tax=Psychromonas sp. SA13A TaxID=2686346 RepID=UPI00140BA07F|nr:MFS transporter [Psychromonas sp. SA13A]